MLEGRYAVITGASLGLGAEIARHFVSSGASVMLCARGADRLHAIRAELSAGLRAGQQVLARTADIGVEDDVASLFRAAFDAFPRLDILVNNAGVRGPIGRLEEIDAEAWTQALGVNLFGTMYCCRAALPAMRRARHGKIINLSGGDVTAPTPHFSAYAAARAAIVRLTETLALEAAEDGIDVNAVAPGAYEGGTPLAVGAGLCVFLASTQSDGITGKLISAPWDRWRDWPKHLEELRRSDVYTLRRITGRERGMPWGDV